MIRVPFRDDRVRRWMPVAFVVDGGRLRYVKPDDVIGSLPRYKGVYVYKSDPDVVLRFEEEVFTKKVKVIRCKENIDCKGLAMKALELWRYYGRIMDTVEALERGLCAGDGEALDIRHRP